LFRSPVSRRRLRRLSIAVLAATIVVLPAAIALASSDSIDRVPATAAGAIPETTIDDGPSGPTADAGPSFTFSSPAASPRFACRLDAAAFAPCTSPQAFDDLPDGAHTFYVRAADGTGHLDPTPAARSFVVDTLPPTASIESGPSGPTSDPRPTFTFTSPDASATFVCSLGPGNSAFRPCSAEGADQPTADLADGSYTFSVTATDAAGNATAATRDFSVDTRAPAVSMDSGPTGPTDDSRPTFAFTSPDPSATFACSIDDGDPSFAPCSGEGTDQPASDLADGAYAFRVQATDPAGNSTVATRDFEVGGARDEASKGSFKASAPVPVPAWYMTARGRRDLRRQARNDACAFARRQPNRTRLLLLDFGKADKFDDQFGTRLRTGPHFANQEILKALKAAADAYRSDGRCYSRGSVRITYGNTNNVANWLSRAKVRKAGRRQAMMANRLAKYARQKGRAYRHTGVAVAGDIEPQWNKPRVSKSLVRGATAHKRGGLYFNYGAASQCPPETHHCANNWSVKNLGQVSYGGVKRPLPEIYRPVHVKQWTNVRRRWNNQHRYHHYCFYGATATPGFPLSNRKGWARLAANNRCVQEELVNIREQ
jgi:hypothetical protein